MPCLSLTHSATQYSKGRCICEEGHENYLQYHRDYQRMRRAEKGGGANPNRQGRRVYVKVEAIRAAMRRDGRSHRQFALDIGLAKWSVDQILARGSCRDGSLDLIACGLGCHMEQLIGGDPR